MSETTPPMPQSQQEWEAHWAFYQLTLLQRNQAWAEIESLKRTLDELSKLAPTVKGVYRHERQGWTTLWERSEA